jgi:hypothetical protein
MNKEELIATATALAYPTPAAAHEYSEKRERLAAEINRIMGQRADLKDLIGAGNHDMMEDNHRNHARFLTSLFQDFSPIVLVETVLWVFRAYRSHGFHLTYWPAQLDTWVEIMKKELTPATFENVYPVYHWMIIHQPDFVALSDQFVVPEIKLVH